MKPEKSNTRNGWKWVKIGDLAETCSGTTPSRGRNEFYGGKIPWVKTGELVDGEIFDSEEHVTEQAVQETSLRLLPKNTLLVAMYGQGQTRGRTGLLKTEATTNQACFAILPNENFEPAFLQLWFCHSYQRLRQQTEGRGGNQSNFNGSVLRQESVPLPPLAEQRQIVSRLRGEMAEVEQARAAVQAQLAAAQTLPAALLRAIFTSPAAQRWPKHNLGDLLEDARNGLYKPDQFCGRGTPILKMFNIGRLNGQWDLTRVDRIEVTPDEQEQFGLLVGDIMFNRVNSRELVGKCAVVDESTAGAVFESKNMRLRLKINMADPIFVATFLNSHPGRLQIEKRTRQIIGMATVNRSDLNSFEIVLPSILEQKKFVARLDTELTAARTLVETLETRLSEIELLPAALLRLAFARG